MSEKRAGLEEHLENIFKSEELLWRNYKEHLLLTHSYIHQAAPEFISVALGDCYIRFLLCDDENLGFNKLYCIFEIGDIIPTTRWRMIIRSRAGFTPILFQQRACFLPAFSCTLDRILTFVYWGEKQLLLQPKHLRELRLKNLLIKTANPSSVLISAANLVWPKSVGAVYLSQISALEYIKNYIFNALPAPNLKTYFFGWEEAPFIIVGDKDVEILTISKTIGSVNLKNLKNIGNEQYVGTAYLIDNNLTTSRVKGFLNTDALQKFKENNVLPVLVIKSVRVFHKDVGRRPIYRVSLYPIDITYLFKESAPDIILTALSLILRYAYSASKDPIILSSGLKECHALLINLLRQSLFRRIEANRIGFKLIEDIKGLKTLISVLGIYSVENDKILYIHPSIFENIATFFEKTIEFSEKTRTTVNSLIDIVLKIFKEEKEMLQFHNLIKLKEEIEDRIGSQVAGYSKMQNFVRSIIILKKEIIPLSKFLLFPKGTANEEI